MLQKQFSHAFATGDHERIAQEMSLLGSAPEPQIAILADDADSVLGATKGEWVDRSLAEAARAWPRWRTPALSHDGWYWANPTGSGDGNPLILTESAVTDRGFFGPDPEHPKNNPRWYPTGDLLQGPKLADIVTPYSGFGAYRLNCHASAERMQTFASLDNVPTAGML